MLNADKLYTAWRRVEPSQEDITLRVRQSGANQGSFDSYTLTGNRQQLDQQDIEALGGVQLAEGYLWWVLWQQWLDEASAIAPASLPCPEPKVSDVIEDADGVGYVIERTAKKLMGNVHKCLALRKLG